MPEIKPEDFDLQHKTPIELEHRRAEIVRSFAGYPKGAEDPAIPMSILHELLAITVVLRRGHAGPPKPTKAQQKSSKLSTTKRASLEDIEASLGDLT